MGKKFLFGVIAFGLLGLFTSQEAGAKDNPLLGRWVLERQSPWWIGFEWVGFTEDAVRSDVVAEIPVVRYDITDDVARVHTRFGETYVFDLVDADRICLPAAKIQALTGHRPATEDDGRLCYVRAEEVDLVYAVSLGCFKFGDGSRSGAVPMAALDECVVLDLD